MRRTTIVLRCSLLSLAVAVAVAGCGKSGSASKINQASLDKAKKMVAAPQPLTEIRPKLVELLGEPTSTDGENLIWAAVSGSECHYARLVVSNGTVNGTTGGMANEMIADEFAKCAAMAGKK